MEYKYEGSKYRSHGRNMTAKEIAAAVRAELKEKHPDCTFSVTKETYAGGRSIHVYLMAGPFEAFLPGDNYWNRSGHDQLNEYQLKEEGYESKRLTPEAQKVAVSMVRITEAYNMDDSDSMTDYFHVNFYGHYGIGKWNKAFVNTSK